MFISPHFRTEGINLMYFQTACKTSKQ